MNIPTITHAPCIHAIFGNMHLHYIVDKNNFQIIIESFSGFPEHSGAFWNDIQKEISQFIRGGYSIDCSHIKDSESFWSQKFIEKIKTFSEEGMSQRKEMKCDLQTGLPIEQVIKTKVFSPYNGILGM